MEPAQQSLILRDCDDVAHITEKLLHTQSLRRLVLENCSLGKCEESTRLLTYIVNTNPDLEFLSLAGSRARAAGYRQIVRLNNLSELKLTGCQGVTPKTVRLIADSCQNLTKLSLVGVILKDDEVKHVIDRLGEQLTTLHLYGFDFKDVTYSYLNNNNCARLQELWLTSCWDLTDRVFQEGIWSLQNLTHLRVRGGRSLTPQILSTFLHRQPMSSMVFLDLRECCNLNDEGLEGIAERCGQLEELNVSWCRNVTDAGISMVIRQCNQLRKLDVSCLNQIRGDGWLNSELLPHLRRLCLEGCDNVPVEYLEELVAAAPQLEIINPHGQNMRN